MKRKKRPRLATLGKRGNLVRLYVETRRGAKKYVVQFGAAREQITFPFTPEGKAEAEAFATGFGKESQKPNAERPRLTNRELWTAFANSEQHLRARTRLLYAADWRTWEQFAGAQNVAEDTTVVQCGEFRKVLDSKGLATATVKATITNIRTVFNWGERMELLERNRWHLFVLKIAKEKRTKPRAEYRADEFLRIWRELDPKKVGQWRPWVAIGLLGIYGNRQNEILNLQWSWIDDDLVTIPPEYVKTGEERSLRIFPMTRRILDVATDWAMRTGYDGDYVLFPARPTNREPHYTIQSLTTALHSAEERAGVEQIRWRAGHGFRRGLMGDLTDETGDVTLALHAIGDRDLSMASHYRVRRDDRIDRAVQGRAERLFPEDATKLQPTTASNESGPEKGPVTGDGES